MNCLEIKVIICYSLLEKGVKNPTCISFDTCGVGRYYVCNLCDYYILGDLLSCFVQKNLENVGHQWCYSLCLKWLFFRGTIFCWWWATFIDYTVMSINVYQMHMFMFDCRWRFVMWLQLCHRHMLRFFCFLWSVHADNEDSEKSLERSLILILTKRWSFL